MKNHSKHLFDEIERQEIQRHKQAACNVAKAVSVSNQQVEDAEKALKLALKRQKKIAKALAKYKKTGDPKHLAIFE